MVSKNVYTVEAARNALQHFDSATVHGTRMAEDADSVGLRALSSVRNGRVERKERRRMR